MLDVRLEGLTLRVESVKRSIEFYGGKLGFCSIICLLRVAIVCVTVL